MALIRNKLATHIQLARRLVITDGLIIGLFTALGLNGMLPLPAWIPVVGAYTVFVLLNLRKLTIAVNALRTYDSNPVAACMIEIKHALSE